MTAYEQLQTRLQAEPHTWLVTGVAGFIGSNLLETLLKLNQRVVGLDNFATGHQRNLDEVQALVTPEQWANFSFINGDIRNLQDCQKAMSCPCRSGAPAANDPGMHPIPVDFILHQAALGSVPRSVEDPLTTNATNITGFLNMLVVIMVHTTQATQKLLQALQTPAQLFAECAVRSYNVVITF